jgi:DNA-directed RNA polymerase subunit M/transcription elongation factor TFIIS
MVVFCDQCGNVLVLRTRDGPMGTYVCRMCKTIQVLPVEKLEIVERIVEPRVSPMVPLKMLR